ncbi:hypothetical protein VNO77_27441 [Canavalia gladiata]|uniref:Uncharacterized protein n=1 Tax=Canavalia gladiata TaxID=3824 RepID=A0AAN9KUS5_CANGL
MLPTSIPNPSFHLVTRIRFHLNCSSLFVGASTLASDGGSFHHPSAHHIGLGKTMSVITLGLVFAKQFSACIILFTYEDLGSRDVASYMGLMGQVEHARTSKDELHGFYVIFLRYYRELNFAAQDGQSLNNRGRALSSFSTYLWRVFPPRPTKYLDADSWLSNKDRKGQASLMLIDRFCLACNGVNLVTNLGHYGCISLHVVEPLARSRPPSMHDL